MNNKWQAMLREVRTEAKNLRKHATQQERLKEAE